MAVARPLLNTSLVVTVAQIVDGEARCRHCTQPAVTTVSNGAAPRPIPVCEKHALTYIDTARRFVADTLGKIGGQ